MKGVGGIGGSPTARQYLCIVLSPRVGFTSPGLEPARLPPKGGKDGGGRLRARDVASHVLYELSDARKTPRDHTRSATEHLSRETTSAQVPSPVPGS